MKKVTALIILSMFIILPLLAAGMAGTAFAADGNYLTGIDPSANAETLDEFPESMNPAPEAAPAVRYAIDLTPIFQAAIALIAAIVTHKLIPWIDSKTTEKEQANLAAAVRVAVFAAEQIYGAGHGDEKLTYAVEKLHAWGIDLDADLLKEAIESAVYGMNNPSCGAAHALSGEAPIAKLQGSGETEGKAPSQHMMNTTESPYLTNPAAAVYTIKTTESPHLAGAEEAAAAADPSISNL